MEQKTLKLQWSSLNFLEAWELQTFYRRYLKWNRLRSIQEGSFRSDLLNRQSLWLYSYNLQISNWLGIKTDILSLFQIFPHLMKIDRWVNHFTPLVLRTILLIFHILQWRLLDPLTWGKESQPKLTQKSSKFAYV